MRMSDGAIINNVARLEREEEIERESEAQNKEIENAPKTEKVEEVAPRVAISEDEESF